MMVILSSCQAVLPIRSSYYVFLPVVAFVAHLVASALCGWKERQIGESILMLSIVSACCMKASYRQDKESRESWRNSLKVEEQRGVILTLEKATTNIVDHFCDCICHIDRDATIVAADTRFPASLLLSGVDRVVSRSGNDFLDPDGSALREKISELCEQDSGLGALPIRLRDAMGCGFQAHAHFSRYETDEGDVRFLVGLVDAQERQLPPVIGEMPRLDRSQSNSKSELSETSNELSDLIQSDLDEAELCFYTDRRLTIKSVSTGFTELSGPLHANHSLLDLIQDSKTFDLGGQG
eukprot:TRINITY_DN9483_c0_g1_i9.p1 TRINITY_DN9483_c0_g1~~TRINITY_DN9483_c0_g1_i9.p1  ORF type:complete len:295 (+),score=20.47 TRINITY_DN9483_c0_g1_i9:465-1349(+)